MENSFLGNETNQDIKNLSKDPQEVAENYQVSLLEEKLIVKRSKQKVGEVIVRKEIETRMLHIPIRREKLIVEKVGVSSEHTTEVNLGEEEVNGIKFGDLADSDNIYQSQSSFVSLEMLQELLNKIKDRPYGEKLKLRLEIVTDNSESQGAYQDICDGL